MARGVLVWQPPQGRQETWPRGGAISTQWGGYRILASRVKCFAMERRHLIAWASGMLAILVFGMGAPLALCGPDTCSMTHAAQVAATHTCCQEPEKVESNCCEAMESCDQAPAPLPTVAELGLPAVASSATVAAPLTESAPAQAGMTASAPIGSPPPLFTLHSSLLI